MKHRILNSIALMGKEEKKDRAMAKKTIEVSIKVLDLEIVKKTISAQREIIEILKEANNFIYSTTRSRTARDAKRKVLEIEKNLAKELKK